MFHPTQLRWMGYAFLALVIVRPQMVYTAPISHVVHISLDGLAAVHLQSYVTNAPGQFPNFVRLKNEGAFTFNARCDYHVSETIPNHTTMLTGRPVLQPDDEADTVHHGYNNNFPLNSHTFHNAGNPNVPYKASIFDVAHDYGLVTAFYAGKTRLAICERSYDAVNGAPDLTGEDNGRDKIDFSTVADISGASISNEVNAVVSILKAVTRSHYMFVHLAEPDLMGHASGWGSVAWSNSVRMVDQQLGRILTAIESSPVLSNTTAVIVTADHGGGGVRPNAHTEAEHIANYTIPFFLWGPTIPPGADLHSLFANRGDPGTNRTDYAARPQPIRDGDAGNLALNLLGLPPIPGSFHVPTFKTRGVSLAIARFEDRLTVFWPDPAGEYALETAPALSTPVQWQPITSGITLSDSTRSYTITNAVEAAARYFRLRQLATE